MSIWLKKCEKCGEVYDFGECPFCRAEKIRIFEQLKKEGKDGKSNRKGI